MEKLFTAICLIIFSSSILSSQELSLCNLFSDHMVLQRNSEVAIWGEAPIDAKVTINCSWGVNKEIVADQNGQWSTMVLTQESGGEHDIIIRSATQEIQIKDVLFGEVWLASGQSNMEMPLKGWPPTDPIKDAEQEIQKADYPMIRMITVQRNLSTKPLSTFEGTWKVCSPDNALTFSASAYFFARTLHENLNIPIGIIHSSWGGTPAESWVSQQNLRSMNDFNETLDLIERYNKDEAKIRAWRNQFRTIELSDIEDWSDLQFDAMQASSQIFDDGEWASMELPGLWENDALSNFDGVVWFRKQFELEHIEGDLTLSLGTIDDIDLSFINGHKVGAESLYNKKRVYTIPDAYLQLGTNTISIRVIDTGGGGGFYGEADLLYLSDGDGNKISLANDWKYREVAEYIGNTFYIFGTDRSLYDDRPEGVININSHTPSSLHNAMIHPIIPYGIKGAIWYQGESNVGRAAQYEKLFPLMINDWREAWGKDFPFYFVQIAPYNYTRTETRSDDKSHLLREAQRKTLSLKHTGMVVTSDIGNYNNIHPGNKQDVGKRLALWALANDYGNNIPFSGPLYNSSRVKGKKLILSFDHNDGLRINTTSPTGFEIAGSDKIYYPADPQIKKSTLVLTSNNVKRPMYARYAWDDIGAAVLFNAAGLPASSFCTE